MSLNHLLDINRGFDVPLKIYASDVAIETSDNNFYSLSLQNKPYPDDYIICNGAGQLRGGAPDNSEIVIDNVQLNIASPSPGRITVVPNPSVDNTVREIRIASSRILSGQFTCQTLISGDNGQNFEIQIDNQVYTQPLGTMAYGRITGYSLSGGYAAIGSITQSTINNNILECKFNTNPIANPETFIMAYEIHFVNVP